MYRNRYHCHQSLSHAAFAAGCFAILFCAALVGVLLYNLT